MEGVELGAVRRNRRATRLLTSMAKDPSSSIPRQAGIRKDIKAAYRFFDSDGVDFDALTSPHHRRTVQSAGKHALTLMIQDTTEFGWPAASLTRGLGLVGYGHTAGKGLLLHNTLAVVPGEHAEVLGLAHQCLWARQRVKVGETRAERRARPSEADRWAAAILAIGAPPSGQRFVHVGDRESDQFDVFDACRLVGCNFAIRGNGAAARRSAYAGHGPLEKHSALIDLAKALPGISKRTLEVRARPGRAARTAKLTISAGPVTLLPPCPQRGERAAPVQAWVTRAWEARPTKGAEPLAWVLITDVPTTDAAGAERIIAWYEYRWVIEEYHKCLNTGCQVEARQLEEAERLKALIGMLGLVAVRLLQLKQLGRARPDQAATKSVEVEYVKTLAKYQNKPVEHYSNREFWRQVTTLGGFMARKGDGDPGWQTLWHGWQKLQLLTAGFHLASG